MHPTDAITVSPEDLAWGPLIAEQRPLILKGLVRDWPLVRHGLESPEAAIRYLLSFYNGEKGVGYTGDPSINGRFHYDALATGLNFHGERVRLDAFLERLLSQLNAPEAPSLYIGSTDVEQFFPGLRAENDLVLSGLDHAAAPVVSLWMGNHTIASAHYDISNNIACSLVGRRRFTLFPPDQVANLYPGPLEPTPGGQVVSMVDFERPDFDRFPRFRDALEAGQVADLEPGDVLIYPALWWHHVEGFPPFNLMMNYWWDAVPAYMDTPMNTLLHGMLSLRDRPATEKQAWRALFDYYIFGDAAVPAAHLPEQARGHLAPMDAMKARRLRATLLNKLNR